MRLACRRIAPLPQWSPPAAPGQLFAALVDRAPERVAALLGHPIGEDPASGVRELRELVALRLIADLTLDNSQYGGFLAGTERDEVTERIWTADTWDDNTAALALMIIADLLTSPIVVTGPDVAELGLLRPRPRWHAGRVPAAIRLGGAGTSLVRPRDHARISELLGAGHRAHHDQITTAADPRRLWMPMHGQVRRPG